MWQMESKMTRRTRTWVSLLAASAHELFLYAFWFHLHAFHSGIIHNHNWCLEFPHDEAFKHPTLLGCSLQGREIKEAQKHLRKHLVKNYHKGRQCMIAYKAGLKKVNLCQGGGKTAYLFNHNSSRQILWEHCTLVSVHSIYSKSPDEKLDFDLSPIGKNKVN